MASSAALILYPCFKDLQKSNNNFVEIPANQKKSRKSRNNDRKEQSIQKENFNVEYNRESFTVNASKIRKKDVEILPTLDEYENEEKEESRTDIGKESALPPSFEKKSLSEETSATSFSLSSYKGENMMKNKFSNHSLVQAADGCLIEPLTPISMIRRIPNSKSELLVELPMREHNVKLSSSLIDCMGDTSMSSSLAKNKAKSNSCRLEHLNCAKHITVMPNTSEFKDLDFNEGVEQSIKYSHKCPMSISTSTSKTASSTGKSSTRNWKLILGLISIFSLTTAIIFVTMKNVTTKVNGMQKGELIVFKPTNYEICLLIGRNVRRLVISSIPSISQNVN